jgi:hypothetical protein
MDFPENAPAGSPCCILQHRLRLPLDPEQYEFLLHFAQGGVYAVVAGDSLTSANEVPTRYKCLFFR